MNLFFKTFSSRNVCANTYCVHNVHNSSVVGRGGGDCLQGSPFYFPHFQKFPYSKRSNNRFKVKYQNRV